MWVRADVPGSELVVVEESDGLLMRGWQHAVDPVPYALSYELRVDGAGAAIQLSARAEAAGWSRDLRLRRSSDRWSCDSASVGAPELASFDGDGERRAAPGLPDPAALDGVQDIDIGGSPLTNALPVRRLGLLDSSPGRTVTITSAWVLPPTLEVIASVQTYEVLGDHHIRYGDDGVHADIRYDADGWVGDYSGLARRVGVGEP